MKSYYRLMLGKGSVYASDCFAAHCVGTDFGIHQDLTGRLPDEWREFNKQFIPIFLRNFSDKSKVAAGLACGAIWTVSKGLQLGDVVLCPDGHGNYHIGEITGPYYYANGEMLPHRRSVSWREQTIAREVMSDALKASTGSIGTVSNITKHANEIETLLAGAPMPTITVNDETIEDVATFAMEKHLESFLVQNWDQTVLGSQYDIYEEEGELLGQQYPSDTGPIDILAISKDRKKLLVVELKKGRASDAVVGQILRYMGYVQEELAEPGQTVCGVIIALEDDHKLKRALSMVPAIDFFRYAISFKLF